MQTSFLKQVLHTSLRIWEKRLAAEPPQPHGLMNAVANLPSRKGAGTISEVSVAQIQTRLARAYEDNTLKQLSRRDLRQSCQVWFLGNQPPGRTRPVATAVIREVSDRRLRSAFMALIDAYLNGFDEEDPDVVWLGQELQTLSGQWQWRPHDDWPERLKRYPLFDPQRAVAKVAEAVLQDGTQRQNIFADIGLESSGRSRTGFEEAVFRAVCRMASGMTGTNAANTQKWLIDWAQVGDRTMAFPKSWPDFASALFLPWQNKVPEKVHQTRIMDTAIRYAGDPRIAPLRWDEVQKRFAAAYNTILRWLTEGSVKQFFDIVSRMLDGNDLAMWKARRKFWTAYLDAGHITAAWVAFGRTGERFALDAATASGDSSLKLFGRIIPGTGKAPDHCALLMHIGDMTIVEWSHNGKCRFWPRGAKGAPVLFRRNNKGIGDYSANDLMSAELGIAHMSGWQMRIAITIQQHTGIRMPPGIL